MQFVDFSAQTNILKAEGKKQIYWEILKASAKI